jgi:hypothetical protein
LHVWHPILHGPESRPDSTPAVSADRVIRRFGLLSYRHGFF